MTKKDTHIFVKYVTFILLGIAVLGYQTGYGVVQKQIVEVQQSKKNAPKSHDTSKQHQHEEVIAQQDVFLSVSGIHIFLELYQVKEIVFTEVFQNDKIYLVPEALTPFLKTLFRQVISPNAP